jgi:hypothetical protein
VRLGASSELGLVSARGFELAGGTVWSRVVPGPAPFSVEARRAGTVVTALGTEFEVVASGAEARILVLSGRTRVTSGRGGELMGILERGEEMRVEGGVVRERGAVRDLLLATRWMHELLVLKGRDHPELVARVDDLFAQIGEQKMAYLYEGEIRALGDHCALPMTRYIQSPRSSDAPGKRVTAARILADVAQPWSIPDLIELLGDEDRRVSFQALRALYRLSSRPARVASESAWGDLAEAAVDAERASWRRWWEENRERFPAGP